MIGKCAAGATIIGATYAGAKIGECLAKTTSGAITLAPSPLLRHYGAADDKMGFGKVAGGTIGALASTAILAIGYTIAKANKQ